ncbi:MAG: hypothetical protein QOC66_4281 [Pseudonocardiales bacterium]|nr:hypothetical protein [Pseudonocardiales bacterium]
MRAFLAATLVPLLSISLAAAVLAPRAAAATPDVWSASGPSTTVLSDGTSGDPSFSYSLDPAGYSPQSWSFTAVASSAGSLVLPYDYSGFHAYFQVTVQLTAVVLRDGGVVSSTLLVNDGPVDCCTPPSGGFHYTGTTTVQVQPGDVYGFIMSGSNGDIDNRLIGTLTVVGPHVDAPYVDADQVAENTSWATAAPLTTAGADGVLTAPGQARWYKFPVVPTSQVQVTLSNLAANYDLTLYSDIGAAFTQLTTTTDLNTIGAEQTGNAYAPSIYSPSIYSPSIYSPSIYSPSDVFLQAFSNAQTRSLIGIGAQDGTADESISAATYNNTGNFYVRVQGRNGAFDTTPFHVGLATTGGPCTGITLNSYASDATLTGAPGAARNVILTDSSRLTPTTALNTDLGRLASATNGVLIDVSRSQRVVHLNQQADANPSCAYAKNLVAQAIRDIVNTYRDANGTLKYVSIIGGDGAIPFFRYPDTAGIGPENNYVPPVLGTSASQASLQGNNTLGQDAYGAVSDLSLKGTVLPVPDLSVGRLVETAAEVDGQLQQFLGLTNQTLPTPHSSLVTGYDFLTSAADSVQADLQAGLGTGARTDTLITNQGVPTTTVTPSSGPTRTASWTATDLSKALFNSRHDMVFLAGHFSANSTLAADYSTSLVTTDFAAHPAAFTNSLVFSAGCHSGYNLVDADGVPGLTLGLDWAQEMAQQKAILVAGTGYQYADTNFLAFSAKLYTLFAHQLRAGRVGTPVAIGEALVKAKQDYLEGLTAVGGIDQKSVIESTLYGLPMTGVDLPSGRTGVPTVPAGISTDETPSGTPGNTLGLRTADLQVDTPTTPHTSPVLNLNGTPTGTNYSWLSGTDGVNTQPALPALPKQIVDATSTTDASLRGVGFRSGSYTDASGLTPLTGAPATEQNGVHTTFASPQFFPQNLYAVNYYDALGAANSDGRTRVILTPAQYRSQPGTATDTLRKYSHLGLSLYYSSNTEKYGQNTPALAQAPSISQVTSVLNAAGTGVDVSAHVTGDPSAGIQQVWMTYTGETGPFHGAWASLDLTQDATDSTLWTATLPLPDGQDPTAVRFLLQAVNGVGVVGLDNNLGAGYTPGIIPGVQPPDATATHLTVGSVPASVTYGSTLAVSATLTGAPAGSAVNFDIGQGQVAAITDANGHVSASIPALGSIGVHHVTATYAGDAEHLPSSGQSNDFTETKAPTSLVLKATRGSVLRSLQPPLAKLPLVNMDTGLVATLSSAGTPLAQKAVLFTLRSSLTGKTISASRTTDLNGRAVLGIVTVVPGVYVVTGVFGTSAAGAAVDSVYGPSSTPATSYVLLPGIAIQVR